MWKKGGGESGVQRKRKKTGVAAKGVISMWKPGDVSVKGGVERAAARNFSNYACGAGTDRCAARIITEVMGGSS